jgi:hypothetical protein
MTAPYANFRIERDLHFDLQGHVRLGKLVVGGLEWIQERGQWACHWSVAYVHPEPGRIYGKDPLDAVVKTLDFLSSLVRGSEIDGLKVWWLDQGDHAGLTFPLSEGKKWEGMSGTGVS